MTEKETKIFAINYINQKLEQAENENFIRYTFFELKVRHNLSEEEVDGVLRISRDYFQNKGYEVYFTGAKFTYRNTEMVVEPNELMIAVRENN